MPEDGLGVSRWDAEVFEQRPYCMPQMVEFDDPDLVGAADATERRNQVARLDRPSGATGEYQAEIRPGPAHVCAAGVLAFALEFERLADGIEARETTLTCP